MKKITIIAITLIITSLASAHTWECSDAAGVFDVEISMRNGHYDRATVAVSYKNENLVTKTDRFVQRVDQFGGGYGPHSYGAPRITTYSFYLGNKEVEACKLQMVYAKTNPNVWTGEDLRSLLNASQVFLSLRCDGNPVLIDKKLRCY